VAVRAPSRAWVSRQLFYLVYISISAVTAAIGSALTAGHFWKRAPKVTKRALAPPLGASPRLGMPAVRHCFVGPPRSAIHGRVAATPASMPGCPLRNTCLRPSWFNGAPEIKSQIKSRATATAKPGREAAFPPVGAGLSGRRIAAMTRQASSHRSSRTPRRSGRLSGRLALLVILILGAPLNHAGRHPILIWGVNRQDAGLAALGHGWPIAAAPQINVG
jgi:hypothetical protein